MKKVQDISISLREFRDVMDFIIEKGIKKSILVFGASGIGKSETIEEIAEKYDYNMINKRLIQMSEVELGGLFVPNEEKDRALCLQPEWFPTTKDKKTIIVLDDITSCNEGLQRAAYQLILDRRIGEFKLPDNTIVIALDNGLEEYDGYMELSSALADRFCIFNVRCDSKVWLEDYAMEKLHPMVISFISAYPEKLYTKNADSNDIIFATPRSWKTVSDMLFEANYEDGEMPSYLEHIIYSCIDEVTASEFIEVLQHKNIFQISRNIIQGHSYEIPENREEKILLINCSLSLLFADIDALKNAGSSDDTIEKVKKEIYNVLIFSGKLPGELMVLIHEKLKSKELSLVKAIYIEAIQQENYTIVNSVRESMEDIFYITEEEKQKDVNVSANIKEFKDFIFRPASYSQVLNNKNLNFF